MPKIALYVRRPDAPSFGDALATVAALLELLRATVGVEPPEEAPNVPRGNAPPEVTPSGRLVVPEGEVPQILSDAIQRYWPEAVWRDAARVAYYESSWSPYAERNTLDRAGGRCGVPIGRLPNGTPIVSEQSVGYYQINVCAHGHDREYWRDVDNNVSYAAKLYAKNGWADWQETGRKLGLLR